MHWLAAVLIEPGVDPEDQVSALMAPYAEEPTEGAASDEAFWDWYVIGGRFTGAWSDYDPSADPRNRQSCRLCGGSGKRTDRLGVQHRAANPDYGCNGCGSTGVELKFPTDFVRHYGDIQPPRIALAKRVPATVVSASGVVHKERWDDTSSTFITDEQWESTCRAAFDEHPDHLAVVVDYHN